MNEENEKNTINNTNFAGDDLKINYCLDKDFSHGFDIFISNHCTVYSDFDYYSDKKLSNVVFIMFI